MSTEESSEPDKNPDPNPNKKPAHALWVELATRITTQPLHYRSGDEETAARSVSSLFSKTRELLTQHPKADDFRGEALQMLNVVIRPYTARWHRWMTADHSAVAPDAEENLVFRDEVVRRMFRDELRQLQPELIEFKARLAKMAEIPDIQQEPPEKSADVGGPIAVGIGAHVDFVASPDKDFANVVVHDEINKKEKEEIHRRRETVRREARARQGEPPGEEAPVPERLLNATGLALSGGGIRSATYCLGIVQVLVRRGLFKEIDYLSTVSGGGYLGSFLSCALGTRPDAKATIAQRTEAVFDRTKSGTESGLIRHLRNNSKYLLNGGIAAKLRIAGLLASGILWNMLIVLPVPLIAAAVAYLLAVEGDWWGWGLSVAVADMWPLPASPAATGLYFMFCATGIAVLILPLLHGLAHGRNPNHWTVTLRRLYIIATLIVACILVLALAIYLQPVLFYGYEWLRQTLTRGDFLGKISNWLPPAATGTASVVLGVLSTVLASSWPRLKVVATKLFILSGPLFFVVLYLMIGNRLGLGRTPDFEPYWSLALVIGAAVFLTVWSLLAVNINAMAPHVYYRSKLCECYLARRRDDGTTTGATAGAVAPATNKRATFKEQARYVVKKVLTGEFAQNRTEALQQVPLSGLGAHAAAPYHLINTIVNLPGSDSKELRGRDGDFFLISKHFCGAPLVGYRRTEKVVAGDPHLDLGTAMAVSGAAASTSMGWKSLPNFRFLMSMLNVRLGYWLRWDIKLVQPGAWYFFREMMASMDEHGRFLNLSDGGHIENLGAYELLRRRCKFIVCVDGGQESGMECADLTRLQRYAKIDFGIDFEYGIADLTVQANGFSRASAIMVKIIYSRRPDGKPKELGWMIYLKLAVTGVEPMYVLDYRRENPLFPHQSTGDQIYDEAQFEAYRRLGECAADHLFREELFSRKKPLQPTTLHNWFQGLANNLVADNDPVFDTPEKSITASKG